MGMPSTTYTVLSAIAQGDLRSDVKYALSKFNLFAFIVHDPVEHSGFGRELARRFDYYDHLTGEKLLFFALLAPPSEWLPHGAEREYYRKLVNWQPTVIARHDECSAAFSLTIHLGVPVDALPALIVTHNLDGKEFFWFKTSEDQLKEQLEKLGYMAARHESDELSHLIKDEQLGLSGGHSSKRLAENISRVLSDVLCFAASKERTPVRPQATHQSRQVLKNLLNSLQSVKRKLDSLSDREQFERDTQELDALSYKISALVSLQAKAPHASESGPLFMARPSEEPGESLRRTVRRGLFPPPLHSLEMPVLEKESVFILKTALKVFDVLAGDISPEPTSEDALDFTPCVICFAKVFEREINLSIGHWIRKELGVVLPDYFDKPQPRLRAILLPEGVPNPRGIDFNRAKGGRWNPPGIGESRLASRTLGRTKLPEGWMRQQFDTLLTDWEVIQVNRNKAAHTELIDEHTATEVRRALERVASRKVFEELWRLKCLYRGE